MLRLASGDILTIVKLGEVPLSDLGVRSWVPTVLPIGGSAVSGSLTNPATGMVAVESDRDSQAALTVADAFVNDGTHRPLVGQVHVDGGVQKSCIGQVPRSAER